MDRKKIITGSFMLYLLITLPVNSSAQELIFERQVQKTPYSSNFGPNRTHFYHGFLSPSILIQGFPESTTNSYISLSGRVNLGLRYKFKVSKLLAIGADCGTDQQFQKIDQSVGKSFPDSITHKSQSLRITGLFAGVFVRIRLGQRGDYLGKYMDMGLIGHASLMCNLVTKDDVFSVGPKPVLHEKTLISRSKDFNKLNYKAFFRIGFDRLSLIASYRLSRLIKTTSGQDLPGLEIGLEISPVRY